MRRRRRDDPNAPSPEEIRRLMAYLGSRTSPAKRRAATENARKANAARWGRKKA